MWAVSSSSLSFHTSLLGELILPRGDNRVVGEDLPVLGEVGAERLTWEGEKKRPFNEGSSSKWK